MEDENDCRYFLSLTVALAFASCEVGVASATVTTCKGMSVSWNVAGVTSLVEDKSRFRPEVCEFVFVGVAPAGAPLAVTLEFTLEDDVGYQAAILQQANGTTVGNPGNVREWVTCPQIPPDPRCSAGRMQLSANYRNVESRSLSENYNVSVPPRTR